MKSDGLIGKLVLIKEEVSEFLIGYPGDFPQAVNVGLLIGYAAAYSKEDSEMIECIVNGHRILLFEGEFTII